MTDDNTIEFACASSLMGVVSEPQPAYKQVPEWYRVLETEMNGDRTVKNCMPFLESLTSGWILPVPVDIRLTISADDGEAVIHNHLQDDPLMDPVLEAHSHDQVGRDSHPAFPKPLVKFVNPWMIDTPDGVSCLFVPPLNRQEARFQPFSGVVQTDEYRSTVNIPALWTGGDFDGVIEAGTPLAQVIPIYHDRPIEEGVIREMTPSEIQTTEKAAKVHEGNENLYRDAIFEPMTKAVSRPAKPTEVSQGGSK